MKKHGTPDASVPRGHVPAFSTKVLGFCPLDLLDLFFFSRFKIPGDGGDHPGKDCGTGRFAWVAFLYTLPSTPVPNKVGKVSH